MIRCAAPAAGVSTPARFPGDRRACSGRCTASDVLRWTGRANDVDSGSDAMLFPTRSLLRGTPLVHEGARFDGLHFVCAGSFKSVQTDGFGSEHVHDFAMRGDALGLDGLCEGRYRATVVALEDSLVAAVPHPALVAHPLPALERLLHWAASRELVRSGWTMQIMATAGAEARVARFLLALASRQAGLGYSRRFVRLRMTRRDIASHIGVAYETVSRSFTALAGWGIIRVGLREIEILDEDALHALPASGGPDFMQGWPHAGRLRDRRLAA